MIQFPQDEIKVLQHQSKIITSRVSRDYSRFKLGEIIQTPWKKNYMVSSVQKVNNINKHPYFSDLTQDQIQFLSKYKRIKILTLDKI